MDYFCWPNSRFPSKENPPQRVSTLIQPPPTTISAIHTKSPNKSKQPISPTNYLSVQPSPLSSSSNHSIHSSNSSSSSNSTPSLVQSPTTTTNQQQKQQTQRNSQIPNYQHRSSKTGVQPQQQQRQSVSRTDSLSISSSSTSHAISAATTATVGDDDEPQPIVQSPPFPVELSLPSTKPHHQSQKSPPTSPPPVLLPRMRNYNSNIRQPKNYNRAPPNAPRSTDIISEMNHMYQHSPFAQRRNVMDTENSAACAAGGPIREHTFRPGKTQQQTNEAIYSNLGKLSINNQINQTNNIQSSNIIRTSVQPQSIAIRSAPSQSNVSAATRRVLGSTGWLCIGNTAHVPSINVERQR